MQFWFALVAPEETTFAAEHQREDLEVVAFEMVHDEGDFPALSIDVRNHRVGLLNAGEKQWLWFAANVGGTPTPIFFGRIVGVPEDLHAEVVRLAFVAKPADWDEQRATLAEALKVVPYWDPVFVEEERREDPDAVLEARPQLWHVDRFTHAVTVSSVVAGEDGTVAFGGDDVSYDSLRIGYGQPPLRRVRVEAEVSWDQRGNGTVDITKKLIRGFHDAGTTKKHVISSFTGAGLANDWPEKEDEIGSGWRFGRSKLRRGDGVWVPRTVTTVVMTNATSADFPLWHFKPTLNVKYDATRSKTETLTFTLKADTQAIVTDAGEEDVLILSIASDAVGEPVDPPDSDSPEGVKPIRKRRKRRYFPTDRGQESVQYLIALARAGLLKRARAVELSFEVPFEEGLALSCRKSASVADARLPGGTATGKITGYALFGNGDSGTLGCRVTIGCMVGKGNTVSASAGAPDYAEGGYADDPWQTRTGETVMPFASEITYVEKDLSGVDPNDDGVNFNHMTPARVIRELEVTGGEADQRAVLEATAGEVAPGFFAPHRDVAAAIEALDEIYTQVRLKLVPLEKGPFTTAYALTVSDLMVPKGIDLEAAA